MPVDHETVIVRGQRLGDLISIDRKVIFFTTRPDYQRYDGKIFKDAREARETLEKGHLIEKQLTTQVAQ